MIWGVGTGRCGTRSLAADYGGLHEPNPKIRAWGAQYARGILEEPLVDKLKEIIHRRKRLKTTLVSDFQHSYVMDLIEEIDPEAQFVFLIRNPFECIASFILGGAFSDTDHHGVVMAQPPEGWVFATDRIEKVLYHYTYTNLRIIEHMTKTRVQKKPWTIIFTKDLQSRENYYPERVFDFSRSEAAYVLQRTSDIWEKAKKMWNTKDDEWFLEFEARAAKF